ncbi:hypothetical protein AB0M43_01540 [Longispora sp. NPDC051575]|uniref:hypothetical protein n=1 Tax=Longispora sp. NPDC051575 TaxID=3154943 RepID=UPI003447A0DC
MTTSTIAPPPAATLSPLRLNLMRVGYLILGGGLAVVKWPTLLHAEDWTLMGGVVTSMLVALSVLALLGLRHPLAMLPVLLFELLWKAIWLGFAALPTWIDGTTDAGTAGVARDCAFVVVIALVIPWDHVYRKYLAGPGDPWRR